MAPLGLAGKTKVHALELAKLEATEDGSLVPKQGENVTLAVDLIVLAIGQATHAGFLSGDKVKLERGRIVVDRATGQTSAAKYFAGGDCTNGGREVVDAVADGKRAGIGISAWLEGQNGDA
jgi:glutamate synthase (NADPH/NADH) small chain